MSAIFVMLVKKKYSITPVNSAFSTSHLCAEALWCAGTSLDSEHSESDFDFIDRLISVSKKTPISHVIARPEFKKNQRREMKVCLSIHTYKSSRIGILTIKKRLEYC